MKLLIADDDPELRESLSELATAAGYEPEVAGNGVDAWEALSRPDGPSLCLLDWGLPDMDGLQVCERLRRLDGLPYVYVLVLTGRGGRHDAVRALAAGADDYLKKPFDSEELLARLRTGRRLVELQHALQKRAMRDALTGLWNREAALEALERELVSGRRAHKPVAVALGDIDYFKQINDQHGHDAGDEVLRAVSTQLPSAVRASDGVARYGGDELLMILPGCSAEAGAMAAERARRLVSEHPIRLATGTITVSMSFGVASVYAADDTSVGSLLRAADQALYQAKQRGRHCVVTQEHA